MTAVSGQQNPHQIDWQQIEQLTVLGLGKSGCSVLRFVLRQFRSRIQAGQLQVNVIDSRTDAPGREEAIQLLGQEHVVCRPWGLEDTLAADAIVLSPGIDSRDEALELARQAGVIIVGDIELFAHYVDQPVIAITGSNGKSTVTRMIEFIAQQEGIDAVAAGNIGLPALDALAQQAALYVLELSSFQLETVETLKPIAATVLNLSPDHLDRYPGMRDYAAAKMRIYRHATQHVINRRQPEYFPEKNDPQCVQRFFGADSANEDFGLTQHQGETWITYDGRLLLGAHQLAVQGLHNLLNAQAAIALSMAAGIDVKVAARQLTHFKGLPHRCQLVKERDGVKWVNDSKATNIGATEAAIEGMRPIVSGKLIVIAGGVGKGANFAELADALKQVDVLLTIGEDGPAIGRLFNGSRQVSDLGEAVRLADSLAENGDMVLLSPACASFDQFANFEQRGEKFAQLVEAGDE